MRRLSYIAAAVLGGWVLLSFLAVMLGAQNANFWTQSLMWSLVASLVVLPLVIFIVGRTVPGHQSQPLGPPSRPEPFVPNEEEPAEHDVWPASSESTAPHEEGENETDPGRSPRPLAEGQ